MKLSTFALFSLAVRAAYIPETNDIVEAVGYISDCALDCWGGCAEAAKCPANNWPCLNRNSHAFNTQMQKCASEECFPGVPTAIGQFGGLYFTTKSNDKVKQALELLEKRLAEHGVHTTPATRGPPFGTGARGGVGESSASSGSSASSPSVSAPDSSSPTTTGSGNKANGVSSLVVTKAQLGLAVGAGLCLLL